MFSGDTSGVSTRDKYLAGVRACNRKTETLEMMNAERESKVAAMNAAIRACSSELDILDRDLARIRTDREYLIKTGDMHENYIGTWRYRKGRVPFELREARTIYIFLGGNMVKMNDGETVHRGSYAKYLEESMSECARDWVTVDKDVFHTNPSGLPTVSLVWDFDY